jgi:peptidoglycan/LPS O-acetylase OafA/YrhL
MKDSPNLDLLRAIAVGLVVVSHLGLNLGWGGARYDIEVLGRVGVGIFFVHTCLVLMMSLERQGGTALPFLIRRAFRIYPLAIAAVLVAALGKWLWNQPLSGLEVLSNLLLIQNVTGHASMPGPLWSLPFEVQMYLFLPLLFGVTHAPKAAGRLVLLWAGFVAAVSIAWAAGWSLSLLEYVPCFLPGVLAYALGRRVKARFSPVVMFAPVAVGVAAIPTLVASGVPQTPLLWVLCAALGLSIPLCRQLDAAWLARAAKVVATYSYGIYLTHMLALWLGLVAMAAHHWTIQLGTSLIMLAGLAYAAYHGIEKHGIKLGVRLARRIPVTYPSGAKKARAMRAT